MKCANPECEREGRRKSGLCKQCYQRRWHTGSVVDPYKHLRRSQRPTPRDITWAAGFLEGEGCFHTNASKYRIAQVEASQVQREPLDRLRGFLGGSIRPCHGRRYQNDYFIWQVSGARARGVMLTLYQFLSPRRREQVRRSLPHFELKE